MLIERPNHKELSPDEIENLQKLRAVIGQAIADGRISKYEIEQIEQTLHSNGKVFVEEIALVRQLVQDKLDDGSLTYDWNN